ncbi:putative late blight resistance protein-like protein R1A-6 [Forsythia ovata]|uniref:Late blight resistance protein-like protein R1A-6 n=1 Tax=Forsythia ovata TaxID=205694 RepID=A0ABD1WTU1_9LAMI
MAYAALLSLTQTLEQILHSHDQSRIIHEEKQITSLYEKLSFLLSFLEDSTHKYSETITSLEGRIRDATYKAEDIIESNMSERIREASSEAEEIIESNMSKPACHGVISNWFGEKNSPPAFLQCKRSMDNLEQKYEGLQKVIEELDSISKDVEKMNDIEDLQPSMPDGSSKSRSSNSSTMVEFDDDLTQITELPSKLEINSVVEMEGIEDVVEMDRNDLEDLQQRNSLSATSSKFASTNKSAMVGFDDDLLQIKERLIGQSSMLKIISIVGMGGIGKTTLARNIYNDSHIVHYFDIRAWTTVSQEYNVRELLASLLNSMIDLGHKLYEMEIEELKEKLYQKLQCNRYLIVMDDVWEANSLEEVRRLFPDKNNGSRIILTTRLSSVAVYADSSSHRMSFLSSEQSLKLLNQEVFGEECCPSELEEIGITIAKNCKGLPLALVVIGGLLNKSETTRAYWEFVAENVKSAVTRNYDDFVEILSLSYNHLPHHLRACFLYMGVFPEDYVIHVSYLIRLWVAEGFLKPITPKSLEEVAKEYLEDLIDRNLIMVRDRSYSGELKTCSIHDLIRDLIVRKAQEEKFLHVMNQKVEISPEIIKNQRHLSIHGEIQFDVGDMYDSTVRSLLHLAGCSMLSIDICFPLLRVLDARNITFYMFPIEIVQLVNLRYIALIYTGKRKIPASISKLCNLQTLIVFRRLWYGKVGILYLPSEILKMPQLRHLLFEQGFLPCPSGAGNGTLQTLTGVIDFRCTEEALRRIPNLKTLGISYRYDSRTKLSIYCLENLVNLHQLETLKCHFVPEFEIEPWVPLAVDLAFPPNLKKLTLSGCRISWKNMSTFGSLPNLEVLKLKDFDFEDSTWKTNEGEFRKLKLLHIRCNNLEFWEVEGTHLPSLQCLSLRRCWDLKCIPSEIGEIPTLQVIALFQCELPVVTSAYSIQEEQQELGNDGLQVHNHDGLQVHIHNDYYKIGISFRREENKKMKVKKGWLAVRVGLEDEDGGFRRFVIPISYLYHPLFKQLLDKAHEE